MLNTTNTSETNTTEIIKRIHMGGFGFSLISLFCSIFILLLIFFNKILNSLTYKFLIYVFFSEFLGNIGKIFEYENEKGELLCNKLSLILIPFSDINIMILFCFFSKCSVELIIKSNRNIKEKQKKYCLFSLIFSIIYSVIILIILLSKNDSKRFYIYEEYDCFRIFHIIILIILTFYISYNTIIVIHFMKEKQKSDKINAWKIAKLIKVLIRFPLICFFYWILYIPSLLLTKHQKTKYITYIFMLFSVSLFSLRGFLLFLNTIQTNKVQIVLERLINNFKHKFILLSKNRRLSLKDNNKNKNKKN